MASFQKLWENSHRPGRDFWDRSKGDSQELDDSTLEMVRRGLEIRPDRTDGNTFWDDFLTVFGSNPDGASKLLGVTSDAVSNWSHKIRKAIDKVRNETSPDKKTEMLPTGHQ